MTTDLRDQLQDGLAGAYTLERELGGGGMARVFVADDTALGRKVVVKVLRAELAEGLSTERFQREIRLAARLQHPHIVPLLAAGAAGSGMLYYTMPFVEGESLRDRLEREGALPVAEVTRVVRDVASALAYAHRQRVVHRDVKPENVLLADGGAVVADFGIAKAIHAARRDDGQGAGDGRRSSTLTQAGTSLGTPAYMAPEQAAGDAVDHRADLYALGVLTYEMLAGRPPFDHRTAQRLLAAHAAEAPEPIERRRPSAPPALAALVMRLLEKNPADRPQTADEVLRALDAAVMPPAGPHPTGASSHPSPRADETRRGWRARSTGVPVVALMLAAGAGAALAWAILSARGETIARQPRARFTLELPADARLNPSGPGFSMALSPDGSTLAYAGGAPERRLYMRRLDELTPRVLAGTEDAVNPQFSPDGRWVGFVSLFQLKKVPVGGGPVVPVTAAGGRFAWGPDGTIVFRKPDIERFAGFSSSSGLWRVSDAGGEPEQIVAPDSALGGNYSSPTFLPDGKTVLFTVVSGTGNITVAAVRLDERKAVTVGVPGGGPLYLPGGYLLFTRSDGTVGAVRFDAERLRVVGDPVTMLEGVATKPSGTAELAVAPNGTLVYLPGIIGREVVEVDRRGNARVVIPRTQGLGRGSPRLSPDGKRIALAAGQPPFTSDIWVYDIASGTLTRLTSGGRSTMPAWTPDGRRIAWTSFAPPASGSQRRAGGGIWWRPWDASAPPELIVPGGRRAEFTPSGDSVVASFETANGAETRLVPLPVEAGRPTRLLLPPSTEDQQYRLAPDGRWLAYVSEETGVSEVYLQPFPGPGGRFQISSGGGAGPVWSRSGKELVYRSSRSGGPFLSARIVTTTEPVVIRRDTLFSTPFTGSTSGTAAAFDASADGSRFIMTRLAGTFGAPVVVLGWADEVRERVAAAQRR